MNNKIITTGDGSDSMESEKFGAAYHSIHGAIQESKHVFIDAGLKNFISQNETNKEINIFEMGFGTGLNAFLSYLYAQVNSLKLNYSSIEAYPVKNWTELKYPEQLNCKEEESSIFKSLHQCGWNEFVQFGNNFTLKKINNQLADYEMPVESKEKFDLVFYDAFAPNVQEDLWTEETFNKLFNGMKPGGMLTTYCAKGSVKRALKAVGFEIEAIPGPPGKREMTRGHKPKL